MPSGTITVVQVIIKHLDKDVARATDCIEYTYCTVNW